MLLVDNSIQVGMRGYVYEETSLDDARKLGFDLITTVEVQEQGIEALRIVRGLKGLNFVGFDLVEVLPQYDQSLVTALLASNLVYEFMSLIALRKKMGSE